MTDGICPSGRPPSIDRLHIQIVWICQLGIGQSNTLTIATIHILNSRSPARSWIRQRTPLILETATPLAAMEMSESVTPTIPEKRPKIVSTRTTLEAVSSMASPMPKSPCKCCRSLFRPEFRLRISPLLLGVRVLLPLVVIVWTTHFYLSSLSLL